MTELKRAVFIQRKENIRQKEIQSVIDCRLSRSRGT